MKTESEKLQAARDAWVDATARASELAQADREAASTWRAKLAARDAVLEDIASGKRLGTIDLTQADNAVRQAETKSQVAEALSRAGKKQADEAHGRFLEAEAEDLRTRYGEVLEEIVIASCNVDRKMAAVDRALDEQDLLEQKRLCILAEVQAHDATINAITAPQGGGSTNATLLALHRSVWPFAKLAPHAVGNPLPRLRVALVRTVRTFRQAFAGVCDEVMNTTAEQHAREVHQLPAPSAEVDRAA